MFELTDQNGNTYMAYGIRNIVEHNHFEGTAKLGENEVHGLIQTNERTEFFIYNQYAKEWQWAEAEDFKPVKVSEVK